VTEQQALDARMLLEDARYESYRVELEAKRDRALRALLRRNQPYEAMTRLAGEVSAIDFALGLPAELMVLDPASENPE
jgi:hypothetical protein